jgi:hypothetical protein
MIAPGLQYIAIFDVAKANAKLGFLTPPPRLNALCARPPT